MKAPRLTLSRLPKPVWRPLLIASVMGLIIVQIVALTPSSLEQANEGPEPISEDTLIEQESVTRVKGLPQGQVPEYSVDQFDYVSTQDGKKQWKMLAEKAFLYNKEKLVHARGVRVLLYGTDGQATVVTGLESKFLMNQRDIEIYGNVVTQFSDGFQTRSEYLRYRPNERRIDIPEAYRVVGEDGPPAPSPAPGDLNGVLLVASSPSPTSSPSPSRATSPGQASAPRDQTIEFTSHGLFFNMETGLITLPRDVHFTMKKKSAGPGGKSEDTKITSDHCLILRNQQLAKFTMNPKRPLTERFVKIRQPGMDTRSRRADLHYGDFDQLLNYLIAYEDVVIREIPGETDSDPPTGPAGKPPADSELRYGTGGRADFDAKKNVIVLTEFPQVYQGGDTVTGDKIIVHRDTDMVEVEHGNSYSEGGNGDGQ